MTTNKEVAIKENDFGKPAMVYFIDEYDAPMYRPCILLENSRFSGQYLVYDVKDRVIQDVDTEQIVKLGSEYVDVDITM